MRSKAWANDVLRFGIDLLKAESWKNYPFYKIVVIRVLLGDLRRFGYWWQEERLKNHLNLWKKGQKIDFSVKVSVHKPEGFDAPPGGGGSSS